MKNSWINTGALLSGGLVSLCCGVPLALAVLGIGSLAFSEFIGVYHWYMTGAGVIALAIGWFVFLREKRKAYNMGAKIDNEKLTRAVLSVVTVLVVAFSGMSIYSQVKDPGLDTQATRGRLVTFTVKGMTCASCEVHVQGALKKLDGVHRANASSKNGTVTVDYDPALCSESKIIKAINGTGYRAVGRI